MPENCRVCAKPLEQPVRGRRKVYCSIPCRRAQEVAIDRLRGRLADVQGKIDHYTSHPSAWADHQLPILLPKRDRLARELARLTGQGDSEVCNPST